MGVLVPERFFDNEWWRWKQKGNGHSWYNFKVHTGPFISFFSESYQPYSLLTYIGFLIPEYLSNLTELTPHIRFFFYNLLFVHVISKLHTTWVYIFKITFSVRLSLIIDVMVKVVFSVSMRDNHQAQVDSRWSGDVIRRTGMKSFNAVSHNRARPYFRIQHGRGAVRARRVYLNVHSVTGNVVDTE